MVYSLATNVLISNCQEQNREIFSDSIQLIKNIHYSFSTVKLKREGAVL